MAQDCAGAELAGYWCNEVEGSHGSGLLVVGSRGSSWLSREIRVAKGWADVGPPDNIYTLSAEQPKQWEAQLWASPRGYGEQAGLYAYTNESEWVKFVVEGAGEAGAMLILAWQQDRKPFISGKLTGIPYAGRISLRLTVTDDGSSLVGHFRFPGDKAWTEMSRGQGYLEEHEKVGRDFRLQEGDPRGAAAALAPLPTGWRASLVTEQWEREATVGFTNIAHS
jgi:hypothetical protein